MNALLMLREYCTTLFRHASDFQPIPLDADGKETYTTIQQHDLQNNHVNAFLTQFKQKLIYIIT